MNEFTVKEWKWAIVKVMMRHKHRKWSKDEVNFEAKVLLMKTYPERLKRI